MNKLQHRLKFHLKEFSWWGPRKPVFPLSDHAVDDRDSFLDEVAFISGRQRTEYFGGCKSDSRIHRPCDVADFPLSVRGATEVEEVDKLAWAHAHDDVRGGRVGPKVSAVFGFDAFSHESLFSLTGQVHHILEVQVKLVPPNLDWNLEVFRNS